MDVSLGSRGWYTMMGRMYWAGQKVRSRFSIRCCRKTRTNFLANPIDPSRELIEFKSWFLPNSKITRLMCVPAWMYVREGCTYECQDGPGLVEMAIFHRGLRRRQVLKGSLTTGGNTIPPLE